MSITFVEITIKTAEVVYGHNKNNLLVHIYK